MINLLPYNERKNVGREYALRRAALILACCLGIVVMVLVFLTPSYMFSIYKDREVTDQIAPPKSDQAPAQDFTTEIDSAKALIKYLKPGVPGILPSDIVPILTKDKGKDISITEISYDATDKSSIQIGVTGNAGSRESLSAFTDALTHESGIAAVDVPVSNFTKDTDITFLFTITIKKK